MVKTTILLSTLKLVYIVKNVAGGAVQKSGCVCWLPDFFPLSLMRLNAVKQLFSAHRDKNAGPIVFHSHIFPTTLILPTRR